MAQWHLVSGHSTDMPLHYGVCKSHEISESR